MLAIEFPFPAEVWGTVSDWVMIVVTSLTALFLYNTLRSQKDVQKAQNKLLEIEQLRLREDFKPLFQYTLFQDAEAIKRLPRDLTCNEQLISISVKNKSEYRALNVKANYTETNCVKQMIETLNPKDIDGENKFSLHFIVANFTEGSLIYLIPFMCTYQDVAGTKYRQNVFCYKSIKNEEFVHVSVPEIIG